MKKRLLSLVLCLVMVVSLCPFGAFASVYKVTGSGEDPLPMEVVFYYNGNERSTQYLSDDEGTVFDPGVPDLERNQTFQGWCLTESLEGDSMTINQVNDYVHTNFASGGKVELYAKVFDTYYVTYLADEGTDDDNEDLIVVQKVDPVNVPVGTASYTYTVDASYTPPEESKAFEGWYYDSTTPLQSGEEITVNPAKDITLTADVVDGFWAVFDENEIVNGANIHASYVPPVFVKTDADPIDITADAYKPTATGYIFQGWFDSKTGGNEVRTLDDLTEKTTVYAHWTPVSTADYTVIIWQQSVDDDVNATTKTYDFAEKVVLSGTPGATINTVESRGSGNSAYARINGVNYTGKVNEVDYTGFHLANYDTGKTIAPQGNTVVNVYYDRNQHTLTFKGTVYSYSEDYYGDYFYFPGGWLYRDRDYQLVYLEKGYYSKDDIRDNYSYYYDGYWRYPVSEDSGTVSGRYYDENQILQQYTSASYSRSSGSGTLQTITALYGQYIGDIWHFTASDGVTYPRTDVSTNTSWTPDNGGERITYKEIMPDEDITYTYTTSSNDVRHFYYYVEALPGATDTRPYNGKQYSLHKDLEHDFNKIYYNDDFWILDGFTRQQIAQENGNTVSISNSGTNWDSNWNSKLYFYYTRNKYDIVYKDGVYVKKSGGTEISAGDYPAGNDYNTVQGIFYQQDISDYGAYVPENANYDGFIFAGWYKDPRCQNPYVFEDETMPAHNVAVYAKWMQIQYHVDLQLNGGTTSTSTSFNADWHEQVSPDVPTRAGYMFAGWYTDENFEHPYSTDTKVDSETQGMVLREDTSDGVFGDLTLHAKWRKILDDASYISVEYSADYGEAPKDSRKYADLTLTNAAPAPTGVAEDADNTNHQIFECWALLDVEDNEIGYYFPGQHFTVSAENAVRTVIDADPTYTVRLKAIYTTPASAAKTFLKYDLNGGGTFDANHGGAATYTIDNIPINSKQTLLGEEAFDAVKPFLGWNHDQSKANEGVVEFTAGELVGVDTLPDERNTLFAVWEKGAPHTYVIDFSAPMKVATQADEIKGATNNVLQGSNGKFVKSGTDVTYQLDKQQLSGTTVQINKAYNSVDTAMVHGVLMNVEGDKLGWKNITTIPAGSVYFDDDLTTAIPVGDGSGYNAAIAATPTEVYTAKGRYEFTFYGTGIDVYCTTDTESGYVQAMVDGNTDTIQSILNHTKETVRYNVPTISFRNLGQGTHKLVLNVLNSSKYKLDGIRVYNPVSNETYEGQGTHEQYATFINLRDALVNDAEGSTPYQDSTGNVTIDDQVAISGALFIDDSNKLKLQKQAINAQTGEPIVDADNNPVMINVYKDDFEAYKENSPKHEIYLANKDNNQQAIVFTLTKAGVTAARNGNLWIGLSAPDADANGGTVTLKAAQDNQLAKTIDVKNAVDMYYPISEDMIAINSENDTGTVMIKNTGSSMISVTNLKITGDKDIYDAANTTTAVPESVSEDAVILAVEDVIPMIFAPITMQTVKIAANDGVDPDAEPTTEPSPEPTPDPTVEPTEQPAQNWLSQLISNFVSMLFRSIARLFGN